MKSSVLTMAGWSKQRKLHWKCFVLLAFILTFNISSGQALAAPSDLKNGNFTNGFSGWSGQLFSSGTVDPGSDSHFSLTTPGAQIQNDDNDFMVILYQDFQIAPLSSIDSRIYLNFWLQWSPSADEQIGNLGATISSYNPDTQQIGESFNLLQNTSMSDLLAGTQVSFELTSLANRQVELGFSLVDMDFLTPDFLTVANISVIEEPSNPVPVPAAWLLLISGMAGLGVFRRNSAWMHMGRKRS
jgi:hypothetical protein